jgi:hypothetical protein
MPEGRLLRPVFVRPDHGTGLDETPPDETLDFHGPVAKASRPSR